MAPSPSKCTVGISPGSSHSFCSVQNCVVRQPVDSHSTTHGHSPPSICVLPNNPELATNCPSVVTGQLVRDTGKPWPSSSSEHSSSRSATCSSVSWIVFRVQAVLAKRFEKYGLRLHPEKTRLVRFYPPSSLPPSGGKGQRQRSFDLLGLTLYWGRSRKGLCPGVSVPAGGAPIGSDAASCTARTARERWRGCFGRSRDDADQRRKLHEYWSRREKQADPESRATYTLSARSSPSPSAPHKPGSVRGAARSQVLRAVPTATTGEAVSFGAGPGGATGNQRAATAADSESVGARRSSSSRHCG